MLRTWQIAQPVEAYPYMMYGAMQQEIYPPVAMNVSFSNSEPKFPLLSQQQIFPQLDEMEGLSKYCWWDVIPPKVFIKEQKPTESSAMTQASTRSQRSDNFKSRRKRISLPKILDNIQNLLVKLDTGEVRGFLPSEKTERRNSSHRSNRQSEYIGVSRNGNYWQVLKNFNNSKKYIGGFTNEKEAAITYDFYSMAIDAERAKVNFRYTPELIREMIDHFIANNQMFDASTFVSKV